MTGSTSGITRDRFEVISAFTLTANGIFGEQTGGTEDGTDGKRAPDIGVATGAFNGTEGKEEESLEEYEEDSGYQPSDAPEQGSHVK